MRLVLFLVLAILVPVSAAAVEPFTIEASNRDGERYANTSFKEEYGDTPWVNRDLAIPHPFNFTVKDGNESPMFLDWLRLFYDTGSGTFLMAEYDPQGTVTIDWDYWFARVDYDLRTLVPQPQIGDVKAFVFQVRFFDAVNPFGRINEYHLRVRIAPALPSASGWVSGESHFHSFFTDDLFEFGGQLSMVTASAKVLGLRVVPITEHSYDLNEGEFDSLQGFCAQYSVPGTLLLLAAEETNADSNGENNTPDAFNHQLAYGINWIPAPAEFPCENQSNQPWPLPVVADSIAADGGRWAAAHPFEQTLPSGEAVIQYTPENIAFCRSRPEFLGWEIWNGYPKSFPRPISEDFINPFPFTPNPNWDAALLRDMAVVDSLQQSAFGAMTENVVTLSYAGQMSVTANPLLTDFIPVNRAGFIWLEFRTSGGFRAISNPIWIRSNPNRKDYWFAGSDGHGSYNYHIQWNFQGLLEVIDNAFGKLFNWVRAASLSEVAFLDALQAGQCSMTDGPLGFISIDGVLQGGSVMNPGPQAQVLIRGESTSEFGGFTEVRVHAFSTTQPIGVAMHDAPPVPLILRVLGNPATNHLDVLATLPTETRTNLTLYDVHGRVVKRLIADQVLVGAVRTQWDGILPNGARIPSGTYTLLLIAGKREQVAKVTLLR